MNNIFIEYTRDEWKELRSKLNEFQEIEDLEHLVSLNDRLTQLDVEEIYQPLLDYIEIVMTETRSLNRHRDQFFNSEGEYLNTSGNPFIIGISGSVSVGKSTVARVLRELLLASNPGKSVELITTDGFLFPNAELRKRGIMHRKGFPESYDMPELIDFMSRVKIGEKNLKYPIYSHDIYDVIPDVYEIMEEPDILIVEGINAFQLPANQQIYMNEYFDVSIYLDADPMDIKRWYTERYVMHLEMAKEDPTNYYYEMSQWSEDRIIDYSNSVWYTINLINLVENIAPTKKRADIILNKSSDHSIDKVLVRKY